MKKITVIIIFCFACTVVSAQQLNWIHFDWEGATLGTKYFDKTAIYIPVKIANLPYKFKAQFDLGATVTMVYGNSFALLLEKYPELEKKIDTTAFVWLQSTKNPLIKNIDLTLENVCFGKRDIALFKNFGDSLTEDSLKSNTVKEIGTIAPDLFTGRILIIDYPKQRIAVADELSAAYSKAFFQPMKIDKGRVKIPMTVADTVYDVMFDTGSSIFELTTDTENLKHCIKPGSPVIDSIQISSWGVKHYEYGRRINNLRVCGKSFPNAKVYATAGEMWVRFHQNEHIIGVTGNALFLENTLIIDYKNKRFGIYSER